MLEKPKNNKQSRWELSVAMAARILETVFLCIAVLDEVGLLGICEQYSSSCFPTPPPRELRGPCREVCTRLLFLCRGYIGIHTGTINDSHIYIYTSIYAHRVSDRSARQRMAEHPSMAYGNEFAYFTRCWDRNVDADRDEARH